MSMGAIAERQRAEPERSLDFGAMLRDWRCHRGLSQLSLSLRSGISQRHISCLETGKARPSRPMVIALADALSVPLRERNALLARSGFAPAYGSAPLDAEALRMFRDAVELALAHHDPYPAIVLDGRGNLVKLNDGALRLFSQLIDPLAALAAIGSPGSYQVVRLCLDDRGLRPFIGNWQALMYSFLQRARQGLLHDPGNGELRELIDDILAHPAAPRRWHAPDWTTPPAPAINLVLDSGRERWSLFTMLAHFGAPQHVTLEELSLELFYPADEATRERLRR
jgi:transcriptional regulator with XRE-family HTH domain